MPEPNREFKINSPDEMLQVAQYLLETYPHINIFTLSGELGSGKTTFVKAFARAMGIAEEVSSPTFSIVHEYGTAENGMYHFDLYRVKEEKELYQLGFEEYVDSGRKVLIEWPETGMGFMPARYVSLQFETLGENKRAIICRIINNELTFKR